MLNLQTPVSEITASNPERSYAPYRKEETASAPKALRLVGRAAAGVPIEAIETLSYLDDLPEIPSYLIEKGDHFVVEVVGDSMIDDGILDGDLVVVRRQASAENGQIVLAEIEHQATIKRYYARRNRIELRPANPEYSSWFVREGDEFLIEGVVVGVLRHLESFIPI